MKTADRGGSNRWTRPVLAAGCALLVAGCGGHGATDGSQVVATVGADEITESQVDGALERRSGLRPEQVEAAARQAVAGLVEQQIVLQKARELKLDREERVVQNIEAMKRQLIATAYIERIADGAPRPQAREAQEYFDANPAQFAARRVFTFQAWSIAATPEQSRDIQARLGALKTPADMTAYLRSQNFTDTPVQTTLTPENVPATLLDRLSKLEPGQGLIMPNPGGVRVLVLQSAQGAPLSFEQAHPAIDAFLLARNRQQAVAHELAALRGVTRVSYFGKFAPLGASAAPGTALLPGAAASVVAAAASSIAAVAR